MSDPNVLALQRQLLAAGHDPGPLDGILGPKTRAAIERLTHGLDVSSCQREQIDWPKAKGAGAQFVYVRAGGGVLDYDSRFHAHVDDARGAGLQVGAYWYLRADQDGRGQARIFAEQITHVPLTLPPALDVERTDRQAISRIRQVAKDALEELAQRIGENPILYTYWAFAEGNRLGDLLWRFPLWLADYEQVPRVTTGWDSLWGWQRKGDSGRWPGVPGPVDLSVLFAPLP